MAGEPRGCQAAWVADSALVLELLRRPLAPLRLLAAHAPAPTTANVANTAPTTRHLPLCAYRLSGEAWYCWRALTRCVARKVSDGRHRCMAGSVGLR